MRQVVSQLNVDRSADPKPLLSTRLQLRVPGAHMTDSYLTGRTETYGLFCFVMTMGILDSSILYHYIRDGRTDEADHR